MGKRSDKILAQRENILNISLQLFVQKSYNGTTVRDIAQKADISVGLLFHYFPTKYDILKELLSLSKSGISSVLEMLSLDEEPIHIFENVAKFIINSFSDENTKYMYLLANQVITFDYIPSELKELQSSYKTIEASIPIIILGQESKTIKSGDPLALAMAFWGAIQGIAELICWFPNSNTIPDYNYIVDILKYHDNCF